MVDSTPADAPPGWYTDPDAADSWRRWDGTSWRGRSMRLRRSGPIGYPDPVQKAMWTTANPILRVGGLGAVSSFVGLIVSFVDRPAQREARR